jgi:hypothetical protein
MNYSLDNLGQFGALNDLAPSESPPNSFSSANNVRFKDGYAERVLGHVSIFGTPTIKPYFLQPLTVGAARYWVYAGLSKIYVHDGTTETNITRSSGGDYTGAATNKWTGGSFNGVAIFNNGVDLPQFWGGVPANPCTTLTNWDTNWRARSIRPFKNFLIACRLTESSTARPQRIRWSAIAQAGTLPAWTAAPTNEAGSYDLTESDGETVDSLQLNDIHIVYKEDSYYSLTFVGGNDIFRIQRLENQFGILSQNCAAQFPGGHIVLGNGEVFTHQGGPATPILTGRMRNWLFNLMDSANYKLSFVTTNPQKNEAWICFPEVGRSSCTKALIWNWSSNTFGVRDLPNLYHGNTGLINYAVPGTWAANTDPWDLYTRSWDSNPYSQAESRLLLASNDTLIHLAEANSTFNGTAFSSVLEKTGLDFGDPQVVKTVTAAQINIDAPDGQVFKIQFGGQMVAGGPITWSNDITFTKGTSQKAFGFATGRFIGYRVKKESQAPFRLKRVVFEFEPRGTY